MKRRSARTVFAVPALIAVLTGGGLVMGLLGDGLWDAASWVGLGVPVLVGVWCYRGSSATADLRRDSREGNKIKVAPESHPS